MTQDPPPRNFEILAAGTRLEAQSLGALTPGRPALVFLHEGLGCVSRWRDFPRKLCEALALPGLLYSRPGYGASQAAELPRQVRFMHDEAERVLPAVLHALGLDQVVLVGHSDGASIGLLHAGGVEAPVRASIVMAPHLFVEDITVASIRAIRDRFAREGLPPGLARHHRDPQATFFGWADAWLDPAFRAWNIESELARIRTPVLAIQGWQDEYGTMDQIHRLAALAPRVRTVALQDCGHSPFIDQPDRVIAECRDFLRELRLTGEPR